MHYFYMLQNIDQFVPVRSIMDIFVSQNEEYTNEGKRIEI